MKAQNNSILFAICLCLTGCTTTSDYQTYVDAHKALNRDYTMTELARISALVEIAKNSVDPQVKIEAIKSMKPTPEPVIERPKSWLER